jgi:signal transduction histidine kinase
LDGTRILNFHPDGDSVLWIGTNRFGLFKYRYADDQLMQYLVTPNDTHSISNNVIVGIHPGKNETLWIGTEGGLNHLDQKTGRFKVYREEDGLANDIVYGVFHDARGFTWIISSVAVSRFDPASGAFRNYDHTDGFPDEPFQYRTLCVLEDGSALIGYQKGLVRFHPDDMNDNPHLPPVVLTGFRKLNRDYLFGDNISLIREMRLSYKDYLIAFEFTALNFIHPEKNRYAYMIEGFDENWNYTGKERTAVYTNLNPGTYTFRVKASNNDGVWNEDGLSVRIIIEPPIWKTWWAYSFYIIMTGLLLYAGFHWRSRTIRMRNKELKQKVEERTLELKQTQAELIQTGKMASLGEMVAGLSHEINNPVTFVTGNLENIRSDIKNILKTTNDGELKSVLSDMDQSLASSLYGARRIRDIVQNMKNFSKLDESEYKGIKIHNEIDTILDLFFNQLKDIHFIRQYDSSLNDQLINCYASQINQCLRNIIINAVQAIREAEKKKILPMGTGQVIISSATSDHRIQLSFHDNGVGIPEEIIDKIFDPFFTTREVGVGKGLGLSEVYGIIQKHQGTITVKSELGKGTNVQLMIPMK